MKTTLLTCVAAVLSITVTATAYTPRGPVYESPLPTPFIFDNDTRVDVNLIDMFVTNHGSFAWDIATYEPGLTYPRGTDMQSVYASGIWIGAMVDSQIHVTVAEFSTEYSPGNMINESFNPNYLDPHYRVYKIDQTSGPGDPDWDEWPVMEGAPVNEYGIPLLIGDQTLWCVYNDADPARHTNSAGNCPPLGLEIQLTVFAYDRTGALGETVFMKFLIINKGNNYLNDAYIALWSDPDIGGHSDDFVGCDTTLWVGYCYNSNNNDPVYGSTPPCVGYDMLQGPIFPSPGDTAVVSGEPYPNFRNLPMTSFNKYINGTDPHSALESYQYMQGLDAVAGMGAPYIDPTTGDTTTFVMPGDPVAGTGWIDSDPSDRRFMLTSGPLDLEPISEHGDSILYGITAQEVWLAIIMGQGTDRLNSITVMRSNDQAVQSFFDDMFLAVQPRSDEIMPTECILHQNYPNPFNASTSIQFDTKFIRHVTLTVFDILGREIATLMNQTLPAGTHTVSWNAEKQPSGIYLYRLESGNFSEVKKLLLLK